MIQDLAILVRTERKVRGLTQKELADIGQVSTSRVSEFEHGIPVGRGAAKRILAALKLSTASPVSLRDRPAQKSPRPECVDCGNWEEDAAGECSALVAPDRLSENMLIPAPAGSILRVVCRARRDSSDSPVSLKLPTIFRKKS